MEQFLYKQNNSINGHKIWMAYPACKSFALSSLGYLWLTKIADEKDGIYTEKVYTDTQKYPNKPDSIAFSLSFDFDFMGVFEILKKNNIPILKAERDKNQPLIFAGGPVITTNPTIYKNIFDFMILGDGEVVMEQILSILNENLPKDKTLNKLNQIEGVYIPDQSTEVIKNTVILSDVIYTPILSDESYFKNTFIIEVSRGCMNRCAFCTASYLNLPFRHYGVEKIIEIIDFGLKHTNKIALLGAQISAHPDFYKIMNHIKEKIERNDDIELGISSLRTDTITPELIKILVLGGQNTSTIAIEAASERLRRFINKNLTEDQILNAIRIARENGLKGLKIYSMLGIPTETQEDVNEFISLAKKIKNENKGFDITFSFSTFVPKPQTPFQWCKREDTNSLEKKQKYLEKELAKLGINSKFSSAKWDYWQTVLSRGDEALTNFLIEVFENNGKIGAYKAAAKKYKAIIDKTIDGFDYNEKLPWDFIITNPRKELLLNEYKRLEKKASVI